MNRLLSALSAVAVLTLPQLASAQTYSAGGNNPTTPGFYAGVGLGLSAIGDVDTEDDNGGQFELKSDAGFFGTLAVGYILPQGPYSIRVEGELAARVNGVDKLNDFDALDNSDISSIAGMANAHFDYYIIPNVALSVGAGIGYGTVQVDVAIDDNGTDVSIFDEENDSGFAYQGMIGARYDFAGSSTINVGYTYFAIDDLAVKDQQDDIDNDFDYLSHSFHVGYAYRF